MIYGFAQSTDLWSPGAEADKSRIVQAQVQRRLNQFGVSADSISAISVVDPDKWLVAI